MVERDAQRAVDERMAERQLVAALKKRGGKATLGDLVVATGLPKMQTENVLRAMLGRYQSHLAVDDQGELLYLFDPALRPRQQDSAWRRFWARAGTVLWWLFTLSCKIGIMLVLVGYFVFFIALALAALIAATASSKDNKRSSSGLGDLLFVVFRLVVQIFFIMPPRGQGYGRRALPRDPTARPFYKKVFSFAFGPEAAERWGLPQQEDPRAFERGLLAAIRLRKGVISATDLVRYTGWSLARADEEATRLLVEYEGEPEVSEEGTLLYRFPGLLVSADGQQHAEPPPWHREPETPKQLTGNATGTNVGIVLMNGFNLFAAASFLFVPEAQAAVYQALQLVIPSGVYLVGLIFALLLFLVPVLRTFGVGAENRRRQRRNVRRALLGELLREADSGKEPSLRPEGLPGTATRAAGDKPGLARAETEILLRDLEGEPEADDASRLIYRFPRLRSDLDAARDLRKSVGAASTRLGEIVYSSQEA